MSVIALCADPSSYAVGFVLENQAGKVSVATACFSEATASSAGGQFLVTGLLGLPSGMLVWTASHWKG